MGTPKKQQITELEETLEIARTRLGTQRTDLTDKNERITKLDGDLTEANLEIARLRAAADNTAGLAGGRLEALTEAEAKTASLQEQLNAVLAQRDSARKEITKLTADLTEARKSAAWRSPLGETAASVLGSRDKLLEEYRDLEKKLEAKITRLKESLANSTELLSTARKEIAAFEPLCKAADKEIQALRAAAKLATSSRKAEIAAENVGRIKEMDSYHELIGIARASEERAKTELNTSARKLRKAEYDLAEAQKALTKERKEHGDLMTDRNRLAVLVTDLSTQPIDLAVGKKRIEELEGLLAESEETARSLLMKLGKEAKARSVAESQRSGAEANAEGLRQGLRTERRTAGLALAAGTNLVEELKAKLAAKAPGGDLALEVARLTEDARIKREVSQAERAKLQGLLSEAEAEIAAGLIPLPITEEAAVAVLGQQITELEEEVADRGKVISSVLEKLRLARKEVRSLRKNRSLHDYFKRDNTEAGASDRWLHLSPTPPTAEPSYDLTLREPTYSLAAESHPASGNLTDPGIGAGRTLAEGYPEAGREEAELFDAACANEENPTEFLESEARRAVEPDSETGGE